jgi:hypothetical protein
MSQSLTAVVVAVVGARLVRSDDGTATVASTAELAAHAVAFDTNAGRNVGPARKDNAKFRVFAELGSLYVNARMGSASRVAAKAAYEADKHGFGAVLRIEACRATKEPRFKAGVERLGRVERRGDARVFVPCPELGHDDYQCRACGANVAHKDATRRRLTPGTELYASVAPEHRRGAVLCPECFITGLAEGAIT